MIGSNQTGLQFGGADPKSEKEARQKKFAEELQAQIRQRDEFRVKEQVKLRGKLPKFAYDDDESFPVPAYK